MRGSEEEEEEGEEGEERDPTGTRRSLGSPPPSLPHSTAHSVPTRLSRGMLTLLDRVQ